MFDITKLLNFSTDEIIIDEVIKIPEEYLNNTDIRRISDVITKGKVYFSENEYQIDLSINCKLVLPCSISLKDVDYEINTSFNEIISKDDEKVEKNDKIINNCIDLVSIVWQNILVEIPLKVVSPDIDNHNIYEDGWKFITDEETDEEIDPRLSKLKDYLGE